MPVTEGRPSARKPNVILIMTDQHRADALGCMGNRIVQTPNIDRLAQRGVVFDNAFTNCPVCMASRGAIHTGRYPRSLRMKSMDILPPDEVTIAEALKRNGYRTGLFGKLHLTPMGYTRKELKTDYDHTDVTPFLEPAQILTAATRAAVADPHKKNYGFDVEHPIADSTWGYYYDWLAQVAPEHVVHHATENWGYGRGGAGFGDPPAKRVFHPHVADFFESQLPAEFHPSRFVVQKAIEFVKANRGRPFFAHVSFVDPHHPFNAPPEFARLYAPSAMPPPVAFDRSRCYPARLAEGVAKIIEHRATYPAELFQWALANYYGMITNIDHCIGLLMDTLAQEGLERDTIVVFTSDHGEYVGDHWLLYKGSLLFDSLLRVPLIYSWQGTLPSGTRVDAMVEEVDIFPTVMSLLGLPVRVGVQGGDCSAMLRGEGGSGRSSVYCELDSLVDKQIADVCAIRTREWKLCYFPGVQSGMLFDLQEDPQEHVNLFYESRFADTRQRLMCELLDRLHFDKDPLPVRLSQA